MTDVVLQERFNLLQQMQLTVDALKEQRDFSNRLITVLSKATTLIGLVDWSRQDAEWVKQAQSLLDDMKDFVKPRSA